MANDLMRSNLAELLAAPLESTQQIIDLLTPYLHMLHLIERETNSDHHLLLETTPISAGLASTKDTGEIGNYSTDGMAHENVRRSGFMKRQLSFVQKIIIEKVWNDWADELEKVELGLSWVILGAFILPPKGVAEDEIMRIRTEVAISSYSVLLASSRTATDLEYITNSLERLSRSYCIREAFLALFHKKIIDERSKIMLMNRWELTLQMMISVPLKLANAYGRTGGPNAGSRTLDNVPLGLLSQSYYATLSVSYEKLLFLLAQDDRNESHNIEALSLPLASFTHIGFMNYTPFNPSFFPTIFPSLVTHLLPADFPAPVSQAMHRRRYAGLWRTVMSELDESDSIKITLALLTYFDQAELSKMSLAKSRGNESREGDLERIRGTSFVLNELLGNDWKLNDGIWTVILDPERTWSIGLARVLVYWTSIPSVDIGDKYTALRTLAEKTLTVWSSIDGIQKHSEKFRSYTTTLLLLAISNLPPLDRFIATTSSSTAFLDSIHAHLSTMRPTVRLEGMLVAEIVSQRSLPVGGAVAPLSFGEVWNGQDVGSESMRRLRSLLMISSEDVTLAKGWQDYLKNRWSPIPTTGLTSNATTPRRQDMQPKTATAFPAPIEATKRLISIIDPDDLQPFPLPSDPSSAYISTLASDDPSLYATTLPSSKVTSTRRRGKLRAPVYIPELVGYLRGVEPEGGTGEEQGEEMAERVEIGLQQGEQLIRRKRGWGTELDENATDLAIAVMGLQDSFEIDQFDHYKLQILTALVVCCPTSVAPTIIEQYFLTSYSTAQRHIMMTSIAMGAREIAGFPALTFPTSETTAATPAFPSKMLPIQLHQRLMANETPRPDPEPLPAGALDHITAELTRTALSGARAEAETTIPLAAREKLLTVRRFASSTSKSVTSSASGSNYSILAAEYFIMPLINRFWLYLRDSATSPIRNRQSTSSFGGAGSGSLLEPINLVKYLQTLSVLLHAARNAPHFLAVFVPEALELILSLRTSIDETENAVLVAEMELLLIAFDATVAQDGGSTLVRITNGAQRIGETKEWAMEVFESEERLRAGVGKGGRAAAGVLLNIEEIQSRYRGRVGW